MKQRVTFKDLINNAMETFLNRRNTYGNSIQKFGNVMDALFPDGLMIKNADEWARFGLLVQVVHKLTRYTNAYDKAHQDSMHDLGVYAFLLEELDIQQASDRDIV